MGSRSIVGIMVLSLTLGCGLRLGGAQESSQPPPDAPTPQASAPAAPAAKDKSKPGTAKAAPDAAAPAAAPGQSGSQPDAATAQAPAKKPSTAADNPFPEEISKSAAEKAAADAKADAHAAQQNAAPATRDPNGSSSLDGLDKLGLDDSSRTKLKLESPDGSPDVYDPKRASEDLRVGQFYLKTGDVKGAYSRFRDATTFDHENAEAVFWLAEAARKMKLPQEAVQNYQVYLAAVPDGPNAKTARKALDELSR